MIFPNAAQIRRYVDGSNIIKKLILLSATLADARRHHDHKKLDENGDNNYDDNIGLSRNDPRIG